jgi:RimJ/RimL family protein N-acetyltransferase
MEGGARGDLGRLVKPWCRPLRVMPRVLRIREILRARGVKGLLRFGFQRLVFRRWNSIVLQDKIGISRQPSVYPEPFRFRIWLKHEQMPVEMRTLVRNSSGGEFLAELDRRDGVWLIEAGENRLAGWGGLYFGSRQVRVLSLPKDAVLLGGGFILPAFRRRGLHRQAVNDAALCLARNGFRHVFSEVHPDNLASLRGLEAAGFERVKQVSLIILLRCVVIDGKRLRRI